MPTSNKDHAKRQNHARPFSLRIFRRRMIRLFQFLALIFYVVLLIIISVIVIMCIQYTQNQPTSTMETNDTSTIISFQPLAGNMDYEDPSPHWQDHVQFSPHDVKGERIDWHDHAAMAADKNRFGPGEQGIPVTNAANALQKFDKNLYSEYGLNTFISDLISVNRSLPAVYMPKCLRKRYLAKLPIASIVIVCRNEYNSVLKRALHSIFNRTPKNLLKEIIIVDDYSTHGCKSKEILEYTAQHFPNLVKFVTSTQPQGRSFAKIEGAKIASGEVLVFLDAHIECNHNWLPPLLEPIALNERLATCPIDDGIRNDNLAYEPNEFPHRGGFNWDLTYLAMFINLNAEADATKPFKTPVMFDGTFAISRQYFWELGGFDISADFWGAEQFELSFKIWMCGGMILNVPCSRVAHLYKDVKLTDAEIQRFMDARLMHRKRIAELWMDEYKNYVYDLHLDLYEHHNTDDFSITQLELREHLKCESFKWYLDVVGADILVMNPIDIESDFAHGVLQSVAYSYLCLDNMNQFEGSVGVYECADDLEQPHSNQYWKLNKYQELRNHWRNLCLDAHEPNLNANVYKLPCHHQGGNQFWYYDVNRKWLIHGSSNRCLELIVEKDHYKVALNECDESNYQMLWLFGFVNFTLTQKRYDEQVAIINMDLKLIAK